VSDFQQQIGIVSQVMFKTIETHEGHVVHNWNANKGDCHKFEHDATCKGHAVQFEQQTKVNVVNLNVHMCGCDAKVMLCDLNTNEGERCEFELNLNATCHVI